MIIKRPDSRKADIAALRSILAKPDTPAEMKPLVEREISNIVKGVEGENQSRRVIDFHFGDGNHKWAVLHDLRLDLGNGRIAQIDHLLINRFLQFWVCESKLRTGPLCVNEHGEFSIETDRGAIGIPSPIEQGRRQISILEEVFERKMVRLPRRHMTFRMEPEFYPLVLVSTNTTIKRASAAFDGSEALIKADALRTATTRQFDIVAPLLVAKALWFAWDRLVRFSTVKRIAEEIAALHKPAKFDWSRKFAAQLAGSAPSTGAIAVSRSVPAKLTCLKCGDVVEERVAKYCEERPSKFSGGIYCYTHQREFWT